ncbi:Lrp/AsnC family transcriptional regulator [Bradyrhizobium sp. 41S5]|uniref:Lrp/AsnC ligand binding domain-containing protein n=1 Tax=Bradyrhizobium sp. 41S5 TaxID=1404443 RepID=UPI001E5B6FE7|nr:Lrp/AsnC family transcriptional regulator [Bradyrhizobium sp. 41S5]UFX44201.1 Lrp/AsnC family transcriptional regulator [Bradyrhizobium sp. 41S5]
MIVDVSWLNQLDDVIFGHGISLLRWRSGGVKHPHDMPPSRFPPSPTFSDSSVLVSLHRNRADIVDRFKRTICKMTEVMSGFYVTGQPHFVLLVTADNLEEYEKFTRRLSHEDPDIERFETMVVMDRVKAGFTLPIFRSHAGDRPIPFERRPALVQFITIIIYAE